MKKNYEEIRSLVEVNKLQEACTVIKGTFLTKEGILLLSRLQELERQSSLGLIDNSTRNIMMNQIRNGLLDAAQSLETIFLEKSQHPVLSKLIETAEILYNQKEYAAALNVYQRILQQFPNHFNTIINIGRTYDQLKEYDQAIDTYMQALAIDPLSHRALNNIGVAYSNKKDYEKALQYYSQAIVINHEEEVYVSNKIRLLKSKSLKKYSLAREVCDQAIHKNPKISNYYYYRCQINIDHFKLFQPALDDINKAIKLSSSNVEYFFERARAYAGLSRIKEAVANLDHCIYLTPTNLFYKRYKAAVYMDSQQFSEALTAIEEIIQVNAKNASILLMRGICQYELMYYNDAIQTLSRSLEIDPSECDTHYYLGHSHRSLNNLESANFHYKKSEDCYNQKSTAIVNS